MKPSLILAGIGNPGAQYENTRHNAGFRAVDALSEAYGQGEWREVDKFLAWTQEARIVAAPVLLVKPRTFVNRTGEALRKIVDFYKLDPKEQLLVLVDDLDLPAGELRLRRDGGPGTHNGMRSAVEQFGEGFPRLRIGIGPKGMGDLAAWVLSVPPPEEREKVEGAIAKIPEMVKGFVMPA